MKRLLPLLLLAACAMPSFAPVPQTVRLSNEKLTIQLSDGQLCELKNWQARPVGRFESCGPGYGYAIKVEDNPNILRQILGELDLGLSRGQLIRPMAEVTLTDPAGVDYSFASPDPSIE